MRPPPLGIQFGHPIITPRGGGCLGRGRGASRCRLFSPAKREREREKKKTKKEEKKKERRAVPVKVPPRSFFLFCLFF